MTTPRDPVLDHAVSELPPVATPPQPTREILPPYGLLAEFASAESLMAACEKARDAGFRRMDAYSPFPIEGLMEALGHKAPMLPLYHFKNVAFSGAQGLTFALYFALAAITFFLPMTLIGGWGVTAAEVSFVFLPLGILLTLLSSYAGKLSDKIGPGPMITGGATVVAISFALLGAFAPMQNLWLGVMPFTILMGLGMSAVVSPLAWTWAICS